MEYKDYDQYKKSNLIDKKKDYYYEESLSVKDMIFDVKVTKHFQKFILNGSLEPKTHYEIKIVLTDKQGVKKEWTLEKTFDQFESLYSELKKQYSSNSIPKPPSKSIFSSKTPEELNKRREGLDIYLKECLLRTFIVHNQSFIKFLNVYENYILSSKELSSTIEDKNNQNQINLNTPKLVDKFIADQYEIDGLYVLKNNIFYSVLNNKNLSGKTLKKLSTNSIIESSVSKDGKEVISPGKLIAFGINDVGTFKSFSTLNLLFNNCISFIHLSERHLFMGSNNGKVYFIDLKIDSNNQLTDFIDIQVFKNSPIISIGSSLDYVFVLSLKKIKVFSLKSKTEIYQKQFQNVITCGLYLSEKNEFIIGNNEGHLSIASLATNTLNIKYRISACNKSQKVRCIHYNKDTSTIYTICKEGYISIIKLVYDKQNVELQILKVFKASPKVRNIYNRK